MMFHPLIQKISNFTQLDDGERRVLHEVLSERVRVFDPRHVLLQEGMSPQHVYVLIDGWAYRYKILPDGRRQITSFLLPGDLCDSHMFVLAAMDHSIAALSSVTVSEVGRESFVDLTARSSKLARALWWDTLVSTSIQREWTVNIGRRDATERMAHLIVEIMLRLQSVGRAGNGAFSFPVTQGELADALGITTVHANRTLQSLRAAGLILLEKRHLTVLDLSRLKQIAMFNQRYLHLDE
ncbi:Crp/FNR family transcriptional regulator [Stappia sp. 22II-S9-Z10]|nr:Crp/FNR family transcriptional regulator [Stappia sp. 22II-S9-Z10]